MTLTSAQRAELRGQILEQQGPGCIVPFCNAAWTELAHIEPSGMGGRPSTFEADNLVGLCHHCHDVFDGRDLAGRQHMLRLLMKLHKRHVQDLRRRRGF